MHEAGSPLRGCLVPGAPGAGSDHRPGGDDTGPQSRRRGTERLHVTDVMVVFPTL